MKNYDYNKFKTYSRTIHKVTGRTYYINFQMKRQFLYQGRLRRKVTITCTLLSELH